MIATVRKFSTASFALFLLTFLILVWLIPSMGSTLAIIFLLLSLTIAGFNIFEKHSKAYFHGHLSRITLLRNITLDITIIILTIVFAGLLGNYVAKIATRQLDNALIQFVASVIIGLLVGIWVGVAMKRIRDRFSRFPLKGVIPQRRTVNSDYTLGK
jgi:hypothetical protein